ncbi:hypothetical protein Scep_020530 [Stephania cephalantha]|uniref:Kinesin-like protein n=1 Tax=Stephania cephalantha TaxID=152367 RepID=A0AAP0IDW5_9MAGN
MRMGAMGGEELVQFDKMQQEEEKIVVSVRLRPLNAKEISKNDVSDWECINENTIIYRNGLSERSMYPNAYTFDRVFRSDCPTWQVYEEVAKEIALSVVSGINASIFAYGQTSSGKTYTMSGITEFAVKDIYDYVRKHGERDFVLRFSAMEIYNEAVRDLLSSDFTPLRLLDDPERGTVVDKLTEETLSDFSHLEELLSICEAQRQIGETTLNETSSRSHQILRLTVESSAREFVGNGNSSTLAASVDFVDLAGSERASQTLSAGARLKEGCHINRSLLTLGTIIRKLSKGRNGHIPYRDSKLTRILQSSLGGNAKTAIICTISPARSHVEQSRNTLSFANCAKEVATNAQVNVVMSDKALVKHLQRELERLESELKDQAPTFVSRDSVALLREKDLQIEQMEKEIGELTRQRDIAKARLESIAKTIVDEPASGLSGLKQLVNYPEPNTWSDEYPMSDSPGEADESYADIGITRFETSPCLDMFSESSSNKHHLELPDNQVDEFLINGDESPSFSIAHSNFVGPNPYKGREKIRQGFEEDSEEVCKEVQCIEMNGSSTKEFDEYNTLSSEDGENVLPLKVIDSEAAMEKESRSPSWKGNGEFRHDHINAAPEAMVQKLPDVQKIIDHLSSPAPNFPTPKSLKLNRSRSCRASLMSNLSSSSSGKGEQDECITPVFSEKYFLDLRNRFEKKSQTLNDRSENDSRTSEEDAAICEIKEDKTMIPKEEDITNISTVAADSKGTEKHLDDMEKTSKADETERTAKAASADTKQQSFESPKNWPLEFRKQQKDIIALWHACNVSLVHRTYFFLLFKGDPADSIYLEVELRRLSFLKEAFAEGNLGNEFSPSSSMRALRREREMLCRQLQKKFPEKEREVLYRKWGIGLNTKQRRQQLVRRLWISPEDMDHIIESANLVAKLVGLLEPGQAPKEVFGLSFTPQPSIRKSFSWKSKSFIM